MESSFSDVLGSNYDAIVDGYSTVEHINNQNVPDANQELVRMKQLYENEQKELNNEELPPDQEIIPQNNKDQSPSNNSNDDGIGAKLVSPDFEINDKMGVCSYIWIIIFLVMIVGIGYYFVTRLSNP